MLTILEVKNIDAVRVDEEVGTIHVYFVGREKPFLIDQDDKNYEAYFKHFTSIKLG